MQTAKERVQDQIDRRNDRLSNVDNPITLEIFSINLRGYDGRGVYGVMTEDND